MLKLYPTTHAYFEQKDFTDTTILKDFYDAMNQFGVPKIEYADFYTGLDLKRIVIYMKQNLLTVLKLMLLEGKIAVFSNKASKVSTFVLTLFSLLPGNA